jgi:hypothetical protein
MVSSLAPWIKDHTVRHTELVPTRFKSLFRD